MFNSVQFIKFALATQLIKIPNLDLSGLVIVRTWMDLPPKKPRTGNQTGKTLRVKRGGANHFCNTAHTTGSDGTFIESGGIQIWLAGDLTTFYFTR